MRRVIRSVWIPWIDPRTKFPSMNDMIDWGALSIFNFRREKKPWYDHIILSTVTMKPITERVLVIMEWREIDKGRDPDNIAAFKKVVIDGLVKSKKLKGDNWKWIAGYADTFTIDKKKPGVLIEFRDIYGWTG